MTTCFGHSEECAESEEHFRQMFPWKLIDPQAGPSPSSWKYIDVVKAETTRSDFDPIDRERANAHQIEFIGEC